MIYPQNFEIKTGFDQIRLLLQEQCSSTLGKEKVLEMRFSDNYKDILLALELSAEFLAVLHGEQTFPEILFFDLRAVLKRLQVEGSYADQKEVFDLKRSLDSYHKVLQFLNHKEQATLLYPRLKELAAGQQTFPRIIEQIDSILDKSGEIQDHASPELAQIRKKISITTAGISRKLHILIKKAQEEGIVEKGSSPSVRDGRLVIPVPPAHKRKISGIVHDESASGKTVYIEPAELVEANNQVRELQSEEKREILRILIQFADYIRPLNEELLAAFDYMAQIDFIRAKALLAKKTNALKPQLSDQSVVNWKGAIHPLLFLSLQKQGKEIVPLDIQLDEQQRILVISGPNAGGKSVCLKTTGLLQYMLQCGLLIPVQENSVCGIFSKLFIDIGDEQSIENDLSTYSSHLNNIKFFLKNSDKKTLLLIDEFGSGTEPKIGGAIAEACLDLFKQKGLFGVITTHYDNLKHYAEDNEGVVNAAMLYDRHLMQPLFRLEIGRPGSSFAVEIARTIGLPREVIDKATEIVGSDHIDMDKYLQDIVRDKRYWEKKRLEIKRLEKDLAQLTTDYREQMELIKQERKQILGKAKTQAEQLLSRANAEIEGTIKSIRESQAEKEQTKLLRANLDKFKQQALKEEHEAGHSLKPKASQTTARKQKILSKLESKTQKKAAVETEINFVPGDIVHLKGQNVPGKVLEVKGGKITVAFGSIKSTVTPDKLEKSKAAKIKDLPDKSLGLKISEDVHRIGLNFKQEIDLRGLRGDEALQQVMYYIDEAVVVGVSSVRLLHGTGTGALRTLIRNYLGTVPEVKSFRDEHVQLGGAGITVVEFKH